MSMDINLSNRLQAIADMVSKGNRLVDVGCDHGYVPVYLVLKDQIPSAIAADINAGPLERAKEHIAAFGLADKIETRLSNGLAKISPGEGDTLVIAGMGGPLMERILTEGAAVRDTFSELILQPQSDIPRFRKFLLSNGFQITEEKFIFEDGKYYPMMKAVKEDCNNAGWTDEELMFGKLLLEEKNTVLKKFLLRELSIREKILENLNEAQNSCAEKRRIEIEEEKRLILSALQRYES